MERAPYITMLCTENMRKFLQCQTSCKTWRVTWFVRFAEAMLRDADATTTVLECKHCDQIMADELSLKVRTVIHA